jgi:hypothetical protein
MLRIDVHVNGVAIDSVGLPGPSDHAAFNSSSMASPIDSESIYYERQFDMVYYERQFDMLNSVFLGKIRRVLLNIIFNMIFV